MVGFFWVGLALDFTALENAMVGLTAKRVVGYEISVLLGSDPRDEIVDKVFRTELAFSMLVAFYSVLIFGLAFTKGLLRRLKFLALGVGFPLLSLLLLFWVKFLSDDHIILSGEKTELFLLSIIGVSAGLALCWFGLLRLSRKTKIYLDDFELPSEGSENKLADDLLDALKERDQGEDGDGIESEQTEESSSAEELSIPAESPSGDSVDPAETNSEVPNEEENDQPATDTNEEPPKETLEGEVAEVVPAPPPEILPEIEEPEAIEEVAKAQPVVEETEDVPPSPLPEMAEEPREEAVEEEVPEVVPKPPPETLSEIEEPEVIEEVVEAQSVVEETEDVPSLPLPEIAEEPPDIRESANPPSLDHHPIEIEGDEPSPPA